ncbi:SIMPL domain-containing protein [Castellaniella sp. FW104-16D08]|uniref:SIMPL domain-containing protein n=1 Tax=unclassified Castellaniella TaxID=2617606 RepID=UPI00331642A8
MTPSNSLSRFALVGAMALGLAAYGSLASAAPHHQAKWDGPHGPTATLSAQASAEVSQDTVQVTLAAELSADSQAKVSEQLNQRLDTTMKQAKGHEGIEVRSGNYRIWPTTNQDGQISEWRGRAEIILTSQDFSAASKLAGQLSGDMPISGMDFSVSRERRLAQEQALTTQAVKAFRARAQALTEALGFDSYRLSTIDVGGSGEMPPSPAPRMMMAMMSADKVAAPIEGGQQTLAVSVSGTILLRPVKKAKDQ